MRGTVSPPTECPYCKASWRRSRDRQFAESELLGVLRESLRNEGDSLVIILYEMEDEEKPQE